MKRFLNGEMEGLNMYMTFPKLDLIDFRWSLNEIIKSFLWILVGLHSGWMGVLGIR